MNGMNRGQGVFTLCLRYSLSFHAYRMVCILNYCYSMLTQQSRSKVQFFLCQRNKCTEQTSQHKSRAGSGFDGPRQMKNNTEYAAEAGSVTARETGVGGCLIVPDGARGSTS
jgi:hypothetical protein